MNPSTSANLSTFANFIFFLPSISFLLLIILDITKFFYIRKAFTSTDNIADKKTFKKYNIDF